MKRMSLGEVCRLLDLRPHVIRYWEQMIPLFEPEKSSGGRRTYGERDIHLLYRLKYLVQERKYTLEGALQALVEESEGRFADTKANIQALRRDLLEIRDTLETAASLWQKVASGMTLPGQEHIGRILLNLPPQKQRGFLRRMRDLSKESIALAQSLGETARPEKPLRATILDRRNLPEAKREIPELFEHLFSQGAIGVLTFLPSPPKAVPLHFFSPIAERLRRVAYQYGRRIPFWIFGESRRIETVKKLFQQEDYFGMDPGVILFVKEPVFPYLMDGKLVVFEDGELGCYSSGVGGGLLMLQSRSFQRFIQQSGIRWFYVLPLNGYALGFPDTALLETVTQRNTQISGTVLLREGGFLTTGIYLIQNDFLKKTTVPFSVKEERVRIVNPSGISVDDLKEGVVHRLHSGLYRLLERSPQPILIQEKLNC
jgi:DNA-binding transcriptional MerR regulator